MPIRPSQRWYYPIDWRELSHLIRFERARGRCEHCRRPHGEWVTVGDDGLWWDDGQRTQLPRASDDWRALPCPACRPTASSRRLRASVAAADLRRAGDSAPRPGSRQQQSAQSGRALPALPLSPRPRFSSTSALGDTLLQTRARRPVPGSLPSCQRRLTSRISAAANVRFAPNFRHLRAHDVCPKADPRSSRSEASAFARLSASWRDDEPWCSCGRAPAAGYAEAMM